MTWRSMDSIEENQVDGKRYRRFERPRIRGVFHSRSPQRRGIHTTGRGKRAGRKRGWRV